MMRRITTYRLDCDKRGQVLAIVLGFEDESETRYDYVEDEAGSGCPTLVSDATNLVIDPSQIEVDEEDQTWFDDYVLELVNVQPVDDSTSEEIPEVSEITGDLLTDADEDDDEVEVIVKKVKKTKVKKNRDGAGCKQPQSVNGWEAGRVYSVVKAHRGKLKHFGRVEYRVECQDDGSYTLIHLDGNRPDLKVDQNWKYASLMFRDLMCVSPGTHHRMTIQRWFKLGGKA